MESLRPDLSHQPASEPPLAPDSSVSSGKAGAAPPGSPAGPDSFSGAPAAPTVPVSPPFSDLQKTFANRTELKQTLASSYSPDHLSQMSHQELSGLSSALSDAVNRNAPGWLGKTGLMGETRQKTLRNKLAEVNSLKDAQAKILSNPNPVEAFKSAATTGQVGTVKTLLEGNKIDPNQPIPDLGNKTAMVWASKNGSSQVADTLANHSKLDVSRQNSEGQTPLLQVARDGRHIQGLLNHPLVDFNHVDNNGMNAIAHAALNPEGGVKGGALDALLNHKKSDPNLKDHTETTPLGHALNASVSNPGQITIDAYNIRSAAAGAAQRLLQDPRVDKSGARDWAANNPGSDAANAMAAKGLFDINAHDSWGRTPLYLAATNNTDEGRLALVDLLNKPGIDINKANKNGEQALTAAIRSNNNDAAATLLSLGKGKGIDARQALVEAAQKRSGYGFDPLKEILKLPNVDVNQASAFHGGHTPLTEAVSFGNDAALRQLLAAPGVDPNKANARGDTPLSWALHERKGKSNPNTSLDQLLGASGIDVNRPDKNGNTPLMQAAMAGDASAIQSLLAHSQIDPQQRSKSGYTPLEWASENGQPAVVKALLSSDKTLVNGPGDGTPPALVAASRAALGTHRGDFPEIVRNLLARKDLDPNKTGADGFTALMGAVINDRNGDHAGIVDALLNDPRVDITRTFTHPSGQRDTALSFARSKNNAEMERKILAKLNERKT